MCAPEVAPPLLPLAPVKPVSPQDIEKVHAGIEVCLQAGMSKLESTRTLQRLGFHGLVVALVWDRLEQENSAWFEEYYAQQYAARPAHSSTA